MATSVAWRPSVRERRPSPITRSKREMSDSTRARQPYPEAFCHPRRPRPAMARRWRSRRVGAVAPVPLGTAPERGGTMTSASGWRAAAAAWTSSRPDAPSAVKDATAPSTCSSRGPTCGPSSASLPVSADATIRPVSASVARCGLRQDRRRVVPCFSVGHPPGPAPRGAVLLRRPPARTGAAWCRASPSATRRDRASVSRCCRPAGGRARRSGPMPDAAPPGSRPGGSRSSGPAPAGRGRAGR